MTSRKKDFCADCWFSDLEQLRENLHTMIDDISALGTKRPLGDDRRWYSELTNAGVAVHQAQCLVSELLAREGNFVEPHGPNEAHAAVVKPLN